ncbi:hypothetical protein EUGRSUZ_C01399 [Eucalyptus grandis]|uniref:Uncharacterized protein n=2 Tax=Eucalyptus grandis TaxID=71139 RepID=A0A059CNN5_EUCGR|nr:hypothetical protein EUGRSUZ_C01399 [Eucalyptus grandis]
MAVGVTRLGDAAGSPNLAVPGPRRHSRILLCHGRCCWLSRSGCPWSLAWLIPVILLRSCKRCFILLPTILCFFSFPFFFFSLSPFLLYGLYMAVCNF